MAGHRLHAESEEAFARIGDWIRRVCGEAPFLLGIGGPGGCGKTTLSSWLCDRLEGAALLPLDDFRLPREERAKRNLFGSHPDGNDLVGLRACLKAARRGLGFERPVFDPVAGRCRETASVPPCRVLICDGEIAGHTALRKEFDGLVVVEAHWRTQLNTRLTRDLRERNCSLEKAISVFLQSNLRDYPVYAEGAREAADFVLYRNSRNVFSVRKEPEVVLNH